MTDEAAESRGPATTGTGSSQDAPAPSAAPGTEEATAPTAAAPTARVAPTGDEPTAPAAPVADEPTASLGAEPTAPVADEPTASLGDELTAPAAPAAPAAPVADGPTASLGDEPTARIADEPTGEVPPAWSPPAPDAPPASDPPPPPPPPRPGAGDAPPWPSGAGATPPGAGEAPPAAPPPWFGAAGDGGPTFSRERLVRPTRGRYVAGVCAAIGRATNTDPVLWRVLLVVLGLFGGVGVLIYLIGWLGIQGEGDTVSPIESLLGRGRSAMAPFSVVLLGAATVLTFAFIVRDGFRATLLGGAVLVGVALLIKRNTGHSQSAPVPDPAATFPFGSAPFDPARPGPAPAGSAPAGPAPSGPAPAAPAPAGSAPAGSAPAAPTAAFATAGAPAAATAPPGEPVTAPLPPTPPGYQPPQFAQPSGGYRPPFAPHGPYAGRPPYAQAAPPPPKAPKPPKPPRVRSKLGRITFFGVLMVLGVLALVDVAGASVTVSTYFAAALATLALGLIVGAWFGRGRGLIFLAVLATIGLTISSGVERFGGQVANSVYRPQNISQVADRYDFKVGNVTLDLRAVSFSDVPQDTTVAMNVGQIKVLLPANVDTTASVAMDGGRAVVFDREYDGNNVRSVNITDQGSDGAGGGTLRLNIELKTGNVEVSR